MHPTPDDEAGALALVARLLGEAARRVIADALRSARRSTAALANTPSEWGLIHADLHYENFLFHAGGAQAIDFDDCGWGAHLYDLAVSLSELEDRPNYDALRDALLDGYAPSDRYPVGSTITSMPWRSCAAFS